MKSEIGSATTYLGAMAAFLGGLSINDWFALSGIILGLAGFIYNILVKERLIKIARAKGVNVIEE